MKFCQYRDGVGPRWPWYFDPSDGAAVRRRGRFRELHERDLPDLHPVVDRDRQVGDVRQLERHVPVPAGVDEARGRVDEQAEAAQRALSLEARDEIVGKLHALERRAEHELAGVEDERPVLLDLDLLGQLFLGLLDVDVRIARVVEDPEVPVDAHVDARRLEERRVIRVDLDAAVGDEPLDGAVGENHRADSSISASASARSPFRKAARSSVVSVDRAASSGWSRRASQACTRVAVPGARSTTVRRRSPGSSRRVTSRWLSSSVVTLLAAGSDRPSARARSPTVWPGADPTCASSATCRRPSCGSPRTRAASSGEGRRRAQRPRMTRRSERRSSVRSSAELARGITHSR